MALCMRMTRQEQHREAEKDSPVPLILQKLWSWVHTGSLGPTLSVLSGTLLPPAKQPPCLSLAPSPFP